LRHCLQGQDGDLIMLGLCTHEPNFVLLREQVPFDSTKRQQWEDLGMPAYVHNPNFEFLHMNVLRDYLAFDFETSNVVPESPYELEQTIDDFVFLTFFVGNDFLPSMPALSIADEAFDLLWYTYREQRQQWYRDSQTTGIPPYLTQAGSIVSGRRLEAFLTEVGSFETPYYDNKKEQQLERIKGIRKSDLRFGVATLPSDQLLQSKEEADRQRFREMMLEKQQRVQQQQADNDNRFQPVLSSSSTSFSEFQPERQPDQLEPGLAKRLGNLLKQSVTTPAVHSSSEGDHSDSSSDNNHNNNDGDAVVFDDQDLKGRYYYDKFQFTPFDAEKHRALRKAYIEGLVWNLKYYYEGCVSWSWFFPYHYGPMLSDLKDLDTMLDEISFDNMRGEPLKPYEQLMACMPPSQAHFLPRPFRQLMNNQNSSIIDFYPKR
jgi:5'-3' exonuclease